MVPGVTFGELDMYVGDVSRVVQNLAYQQPSIYHWQDIATEKHEGMRILLKKEVYANVSTDLRILAGGAHLTGATLLPNTILKVDNIHDTHSKTCRSRIIVMSAKFHQKYRDIQ